MSYNPLFLLFDFPHNFPASPMVGVDEREERDAAERVACDHENAHRDGARFACDADERHHEAAGMWAEGKPKKWYCALPIPALWGLAAVLLARLLLRLR